MSKLVISSGCGSSDSEFQMKESAGRLPTIQNTTPTQRSIDSQAAGFTRLSEWNADSFKVHA